MVPAQRRRMEEPAVRLMPSVPLGCYIYVVEFFRVGRPFDLDELPDFPRRERVVPCEEWQKQYQPGR